MSTAEQWAGALSGENGETFSLRFERMGLSADCRTLRADEVEECRRMGGERGMRYALYLACGQLRQAGEQLRQQGELISAFDITQRLRYADAVAAGAAILTRSGVSEARVILEDGGQSQALRIPRQSGMALEEGLPEGMGNPFESRAGHSINWIDMEQMARDFADRLRAAEGNR